MPFLNVFAFLTNHGLFAQAGDSAAQSVSEAPLLVRAFLELFSADYPLRSAFGAALLLGLVASLAGCFLLVRRAAFLGVALPQVSAAGMCAGWLVLESNGVCSAAAAASGQAGVASSAWSLLAAFGATLAVLLVLAWVERRGGGAPDSRHGALYVLAGALTVLLLVYHPHAENIYQGILRGEVVSVGAGDFGLSLLTLLPSGVLLLAFRHEFLWAGADPAFMAAAGRRPMLWSALLLAIVGVVISTGVFIAGPVVCLGVMLLPALAARKIARRVWQFFLLAPIFGLIGVLAGFTTTNLPRYDWPAGSTIVAADGILLFLALLAGFIRDKFARHA